MPHFYFDVTDSEGFHRDDVGDEFETLNEARQQAQSLLPDIAQQEMPDGDLHIITCEVRDEANRVVYRGKITYEGAVFFGGEPHR